MLRQLFHTLVTSLPHRAGLMHIAALATIVAGTSTLAGPMDRASDKMEKTEEFGFRHGSFVAAPIPFSNPLLGAGLTLGAGYLYQTDEDSNTSQIGVAVLGSDNDSLGYGLNFKHAWANNTWQVGATLAQAALNYDLYIAGIPIPLQQEGIIFSADFLHRLSDAWYIGGKFRYLDTVISLNSGGALPPEWVPDAAIKISSISLIADRDTRDDSLYPKTGSLLNLEYMTGNEVDTMSRGYGKGIVKYSNYWSLSDTTVLAGNLTGCMATPDTPFFDLCSLGGTDKFRGFSPMQYLDKRLASAQIEVRQRIGKRFGAVAFAGVGTTGGDFEDFDSSNYHYAGGVGLRFKLSRKFDADFSIDMAYNDEKEKVLYVFVGQRF